ncbi:hypothetical protein P692DRAFT_20881716, partial [Suillus brevipes Sb2]
MGKYDYITELTGADEYPTWRHAVTLALQGDGLWNHCSAGTDPNDFAEFASVMPRPAAAGTISATEKQSMIDWIKEDAQAKGIICRKLSAVVQGLLNPDDAPRYISVFENARRRFAEMAVLVTDDKMVFLLLHRLPLTPEWLIFKHMTMNLYSSPPAPSSSTTPAPSKMTFASIVTSLSEEANRLRGELKLNGPGSEYANATSFKPQEGKTNPKTGIRIHKYNPKGVCCDNPICTGLPRSLTHDREHCFQPGGGMEGQGGIRNRDRDRDRKPSKKSDIAAAANSNDTPA